MRRSKYEGKEYGGWKVEKMYLAANYCGGTRHNAYRYVLGRETGDGKCFKKIAVSGSTMTAIGRGQKDVEALAERKGRSKTDYVFLLEK